MQYVAFLQNICLEWMIGSFKAGDDSETDERHVKFIYKRETNHKLALLAVLLG